VTARRAAGGLALAIALVLLAGPGAGRAEDLVAAGARWWSVSPDPANPVACVTCHDDPAATRGWAASFPKVRPLPPPHTRVMTLFQATAEAVARHYRLPDPRPAAAAITAYLTALAAGLPLTPGVSLGQPVFPERIAQLAASVKRGERVFARGCQGCHHAPEVAPRLRSFPREHDGLVVTLESFLESHAPRARPLSWDSPSTADVAAYLTARLAREEHP
jgi:mono/diheme cytochrome c family protein